MTRDRILQSSFPNYSLDIGRSIKAALLPIYQMRSAAG